MSMIHNSLALSDTVVNWLYICNHKNWTTEKLKINSFDMYMHKKWSIIRVVLNACLPHAPWRYNRRYIHNLTRESLRSLNHTTNMIYHTVYLHTPFHQLVKYIHCHISTCTCLVCFHMCENIHGNHCIHQYLRMYIKY